MDTPANTPAIRSPATPGASPDAYRQWQAERVAIGGRGYRVATKPGVQAHGRTDTATAMLAQAVTNCSDQIVAVMPGGTGVIAAVSAHGGARAVWLSDRNALSLEAARRTLADADVATAHVVAGQGAMGFPAEVEADVVAMRVVPERLVMLHLLHDARRLLRPGGRCLVAGANAEGAKTAARMMEQLFGHAKVLEQHSSHRLVMATRPAMLPDVGPDLHSPFVNPDHFHEIPLTLRDMSFTMCTRPGVFSWEHLDEATEVLATLLDVAPGEDVLDIGCGAGALGAVAARLSQTGHVCLVDVDHEAVRCAQRTLASAGATNARAVVSDVAGAVLDQRYDVVVANPPFHVGKHTDLDVPRQFIRDAHTVLRPGGRVLLVANRTLPYEAMMTEQFGTYRSIYDGRRFKVLSAVK